MRRMAEGLDAYLERTRAQVQRRQDLGDRLDVPRLVEHTGGFLDKAAALDAAAELDSLGYTIALGETDSGAVLLEASREDSVDLATAEAFVREVAGVVEQRGGLYDGWGGMVVE